MVLPVLLLVTLAAQAVTPAPSAVVLGRVVDARTGRPIPGAIVYVNGSALSPAARGAPPRVMTNARGQFVVRGLRKGTLFLNVTREGYLDATLGQRRPMGSTQPLQLDAGERAANVEVRMWRPAVIAGTIVDEAGEPVVGARVTAYRRTIIGGWPRLRPASEWVTDDRGDYRFAGLVPGEYAVAVVSTLASIPSAVSDAYIGMYNTAAATGRVERREAIRHQQMQVIGAVVAPPGSSQTVNVGDQVMTVPAGTPPPVSRGDGSFAVYPTLFYPASRTAAEAGVLTVRSGEERSGVDLQLVPVPSVSVSGVVIEPDGAAAYTAVRLVPRTADVLADLLPAAGTLTDADGAFTFPAVPSGDYMLSVMRLPDTPPPTPSGGTTVIRAAGTTITTIVPAPRSPNPAPVDPNATLCAEMPVSVGNRSLADLVVPLQPGPRITGRVQFVGAADPPTAQQIQGVRIALERADGISLPQRLSLETGHPDENGNFITAGVPPGRYLLRVTNTIQGWFFLGAMSDGDDLADTPVDLRADMKDVVLTFTDRPPVLTGVVRDGARADGDAYVIAFPADASSWVSQGISQRRMRTTRAAKDGTYTLPPLPPGDYYVAAVKDDYSIEPYEPAFLESLVSSAKRIQLVEGEKRSQDLVSVTPR